MRNLYNDLNAPSGQKCRLAKLINLIPIFLLLVFISFSGKGYGQLLVEDFNYTNGTAITANGWTAHSSGGSNTILVTNPSTVCSYAGYLSSGVGGEITLTTSGEDDNKTFTQQTSGTIYFSFIVNVTAATTNGDYFFNIGATTIGTNFRGKIYAKRDASNNLYFGVATSSNTGLYTTTTYALNTNYLIVLKFEIVSGSANDVASIYINPPLNAPIPTSGWLVATDVQTGDLTNVGSVAVRQGSSSNAPALKLDGIRVSTTWSDIVGSAANPLLTLNPTSLTGFQYVEGAGPSASMPYLLSGINLTGFPDNIAVNAPTDYEVSLNNSDFYSTVSVPYTSATLAETTIWARLKAGLTLGSYAGETISHAGGGATTVYETCNGAVVLPEPTDFPADLAVDTAASVYVTLTWTDAGGSIPPTGYLIKGVTGYLESAIVPPTDHVAEADATLVKNVAQGVQTVTFTGLDPRTYYTFKIYPYTNSGVYIDYKTSSGVPVITTQTDYLTFLSAASGNWNAPTTWVIGVTGGGTVPNTQNLIPVYPTADVVIVDNYEITVPVGYNSGKVKTLTIFSGTVKANSTTGSCFLYVYDDIWNNGQIGGPTDVLGLDIEGSNCDLYGTGSTIISRLAKYTTYTTNGSMQVLQPLTLTYTHATNPALWNQNPGTTNFDILINIGSLTVNNANVDMNGVHIVYSETGQSIMKSVSGTGTSAVWITMNPWTDAAHGWHLLSSPVASQAIEPNFIQTPAENYDFYKWDEVSDMWLNQKVAGNGITTFTPGTGYLVAYQSTLNKSFDGTINTGNVTASNLTMSGGTYSGWNLLGNPFPSAVKWNDGVNWTVPADFAATAKVWNESTAAYVDIAANGIIPKFNGFMVQVLSGSPASLTIPSAARTINATPFYKETGDNLVLVAYDHNGNTAQECVIGANENATAGYDRDFDSHFLKGYAPEFYAVANGEMLSTDIVPVLNTATAIDLGFVKNGQSEFSIGLEETNPELTVYLTDKKTGITTELKDGVEFTFISGEGDDPMRFLLTFSPLGIDDQAMINPFEVYATGNDIRILSHQDANADFYITNLLGQTVMRGQAAGNSLKAISAGTLPDGVYLVNIESKRGIISHKVILDR